MSTTTFSDGVTLSAASWFNDVDTSTYMTLSGVAGTNTITATGPKNATLSTNLRVVFIPANTNTGATTLNITPSGGAALTAKNVFANGIACAGGELKVNVPTMLVYDGTQFNIIGPFTAGTIPGNAAIGGTLAVTGVATLTAQPILSSLTASQAVFSDGSKGLVSNAITGTGNVVMSASPTLTGTLTGAAANFSGAVTASTTLKVAGSTNPNSRNLSSLGLIYDEGAAGNIGFELKNLTSGNLSYITVESGDVIQINSNGQTRITNLAGAGSRAVNADASGNLSAASDSRLKSEVKDAAIPGLAEVLKLQPRAYKWLDDIEKRKDKASVEVGFFANEVAEIIPSAAPMGNDGYYGFYDRSVTAALVNAVKELSADFDAYKASHQ